MTSVFDGLPDIFTQDLGDPVTYTPDGGDPVTINAIDVTDTVESADFNGVGTNATRIVIHVRAVDIADDPEGDLIAMPATSFRAAGTFKVVQPIVPDGNGMTMLTLESDGVDMAHARKQIRDAVKSRLMGLAFTGGNVEIGRTRPLGDSYPPTLLIYTPRETSQRTVRGNPPTLERPLVVYVEGRVSGAATPDDDLDTIAEQVETAMAQDLSLGGLAFNLQLVGCEILTEAKGTSQIGGIRMEYRVTFRTLEGVPGTLV